MIGQLFIFLMTAVVTVTRPVRFKCLYLPGSHLDPLQVPVVGNHAVDKKSIP
jgi:hypothetical protein